MPIPLGILAAAGAGGVALTNDFEHIETISPASGAASAIFSGLSAYSSTYKHLQLRFVVRGDSGSGAPAIRINADTGNNYAAHSLHAFTSVASASNTSFSRITLGGREISINTTDFTFGIVDFLDVYSTSKTKTIKALGAALHGTGSEIGLYSGFRNNTAAITSITFFLDAANFGSNSRISLYGIKG